MRIIVTSDSHRCLGKLLDIAERHHEDADLFISLGDGYFDVTRVLDLYPDIKYERVAGNCDWDSLLPYEKLIYCDMKRVMFCHGHTYHVKHGYTELEQAAEQKNADICLFGHTHEPYENRKNGIVYLNPGSVREGYYGIVDITKGGIMAYSTSL